MLLSPYPFYLTVIRRSTQGFRGGYRTHSLRSTTPLPLIDEIGSVEAHAYWTPRHCIELLRLSFLFPSSPSFPFPSSPSFLFLILFPCYLVLSIQFFLVKRNIFNNPQQPSTTCFFLSTGLLPLHRAPSSSQVSSSIQLLLLLLLDVMDDLDVFGTLFWKLCFGTLIYSTLDLVLGFAPT